MMLLWFFLLPLAWCAALAWRDIANNWVSPWRA